MATVLVAEDEPFIVECLQFLLQRAGYKMIAVSDGLAVFPKLTEEKPDLLILDVMLPEMNGFDVLRRIRESAETEDLPVLVLTAKGQNADRTRILELGADEFVTKPFSNTDLMDRVRALLGNKEGRTQSNAEQNSKHDPSFSLRP